MNSAEQKYRCTFLVNQHLKQREFVSVEKKALEYFLRFLSGKDYGKPIGKYGKRIGVFRFDVYVEPSINYDHHCDNIWLGCARLSAHVDWKTFKQASEQQQVEQFQILKARILDAILDVGKLSRKPKDFYLSKFHETISQILADYENGFIRKTRPA